MANLENLTGKIISEAKTKATEILKKAEEEVLKIKEETDLEINSRKKILLDRAETEAELIKERVNSSMNLRLRDDSLRAKGEVIEKVMKEALDNLNNISEEDFIGFLKSNLGEEDLREGTVIRVPEKFLEASKRNFAGGNFDSLSELSGFMVENKGIIKNYSFDKILDFNKDEIEEKVAKELFG